MAIRNRGRAPTNVHIVEHDLSTNSDWERWFGKIASSVFEVQKYDVTFNPSSVSANTTSEQNVTVSGVASNDLVFTIKPTHTTGLGIVNTRVSAQDTVSITFMNATGSPIDPPSESYTFLVLKV